MLCANTDYSCAIWSDSAIGVAAACGNGRLRRDGARLTAAVHSIQRLIQKIREEYGRTEGEISAAAIFVHTCTRVEWRRRNVSRRRPRLGVNYNHTAGFQRPSLQPVDPFARYFDLRQTDP